jgi:hypothetical protein
VYRHQLCMPPACRTGSTQACRTAPQPCSNSGCLCLNSRQHCQLNRCRKQPPVATAGASWLKHKIVTVYRSITRSRDQQEADSRGLTQAATEHWHSKEQPLGVCRLKQAANNPSTTLGEGHSTFYPSLLSTQLSVLQCLQQPCRRAASRTTFAHTREPAQSQAAT